MNIPSDPFYYLAASPDPDARRILNAREKLTPGQRKLVPIEALCLSVNVAPHRVLEMVTAAAVRIGAQGDRIVAAVSHMGVVQHTVKMALTPMGIADRMALHKATGFIESPRGAHTTVNVAASARADAQSSPTVQNAIVAAPPPERTIRTLVDRFNERRAALTPAPVRELPMPTDPILPTDPIPTREIEMVPIEDEDE
jgi:hypothetical protein